MCFLLGKSKKLWGKNTFLAHTSGTSADSDLHAVMLFIPLFL